MSGVGFWVEGVAMPAVSLFGLLGEQLSEGQFSKETFVQGDRCQGTVVQGDFGPRRLLSKEALTRDKLAQIIFCQAQSQL